MDLICVLLTNKSSSFLFVFSCNCILACHIENMSMRGGGGEWFRMREVRV